MAALVLAGCGAEAGGGRGAAADEAGEQGGCRITARGLSLQGGVSESSGAAISRRHEGRVWTHQDSGRDPDLFALAADGSLLARLPVTGARNEDWEDLALGPCPEGDGDCLYIGDIGDNQSGPRAEVSLWVVPEPAPGERATRPAQEYRARYPDRRRAPDAEALVVLPGGEVFVITKGNREPVEVYRWPTPLRVDGGRVELVRVRQLAPEPEQIGDRVTGADASPDGRWVAVRTYGELAFFRTEDITTASDAGPVLSMDLTTLGEPQGEAVALGHGGQVVLTSEGSDAELPGSLSWLVCALPER